MSVVHSVSVFTHVPGLTGCVGPQLFHRHQHRVPVSVREGRPLPKELREPLSLTQVDLQQTNTRVIAVRSHQPPRFTHTQLITTPTSPNCPSPSFSLKISCCRGNSAAEMSFLVRESTVSAGTAYMLLPVTPCSRTISVSA